MTVIRWGIIGTGWISQMFATDLLKYMPHNDSDIEHVITAVGSSSVEKAERFIASDLKPLIESLASQKADISALSYEDLYKNVNVDIVYVGSPHVNHMDNCLSAIEQGKNVLCEKPVTVNSKQLEKVLAAAKANNVFFMEALWVRFFPANRKLVESIYGPQKILGDVKNVVAKYSFDLRAKKNIDANHRLVCKSLGGGASLDIGVYPLTYLRMYLNPKSDPINDWQLVNSSLCMKSFSGIESESVDYVCSASYELPNYNQKGSLYASFLGDTDPDELCVIEGTKGTARIKHCEFPGTWEYKLTIDGTETVEKFVNPVKDSLGFYFQAIALGEALAMNKKECSIAPWRDSWSEMVLIDQIRSNNGFRYAEDDVEY